ncbi:MAG: potassium channel family protein [Pseudomonadota bacterium]
MALEDWTPIGKGSLLWRWRWGFLLVTLLTAFLFEPVLGESRPAGFVVLALYFTVFSGTVRLSHLPKTLEIGCYGLLSVWFALSLAQLLTEGGVNHLLLALVTGMMALGALYTTFTELLRRETSTIDKLFAALFGYFLIALTLALLYVQIEAVRPGAFNLTSEKPDISEFLYFSLVTVTTLGYGEITPAIPLTRILAGLEAAFGTLYIAILIGQIVGTMQRK